jgi:hypothetical protein
MADDLDIQAIDPSPTALSRAADLQAGATLFGPPQQPQVAANPYMAASPSAIPPDQYQQLAGYGAAPNPQPAQVQQPVQQQQQRPAEITPGDFFQNNQTSPTSPTVQQPQVSQGPQPSHQQIMQAGQQAMQAMQANPRLRPGSPWLEGKTPDDIRDEIANTQAKLQASIQSRNQAQANLAKAMTKSPTTEIMTGLSALFGRTGAQVAQAISQAGQGKQAGIQAQLNAINGDIAQYTNHLNTLDKAQHQALLEDLKQRQENRLENNAYYNNNLKAANTTQIQALTGLKAQDIVSKILHRNNQDLTAAQNADTNAGRLKAYQDDVQTRIQNGQSMRQKNGAQILKWQADIANAKTLTGIKLQNSISESFHNINQAQQDTTSSLNTLIKYQKGLDQARDLVRKFPLDPKNPVVNPKAQEAAQVFQGAQADYNNAIANYQSALAKQTMAQQSYDALTAAGKDQPVHDNGLRDRVLMPGPNGTMVRRPNASPQDVAAYKQWIQMQKPHLKGQAQKKQTTTASKGGIVPPPPPDTPAVTDMGLIPPYGASQQTAPAQPQMTEAQITSIVQKAIDAAMQKAQANRAVLLNSPQQQEPDYTEIEQQAENSVTQ